MNERIVVIIPAHNEEQSIGLVLAEIPDYVLETIVVDNASTDNTGNVASSHGATIVQEGQKGYGYACLRGMEYAAKLNPDIVVFLDGDYSDYPGEMDTVIRPICEDETDFVVGSRARGMRQFGSMTIPQVFGNWLATRLIHLFYNEKFTDLGPFRAIRYESLLALDMRDKTYGWTVEMQLKAARMGLRCKEVPVNYRRRVGVSKVSGTVKGTVMAGYKILWTIFKYL